MTCSRALRTPLIALVAAAVLATSIAPAMACTRALYVAKDGTVIVGRSMDWGEDLKSNMWVLPRGMKRDGMGGKNTVTWESKYGSLVVSGYDIGTSEGMNEKGLVVNMLALAESDYGKPAEGGKVISMSTWAQYVLDNHASVAEAVADLRKEGFRVQTLVLPTGRPANMHLAMSDASGDSAVFEYVTGTRFGFNKGTRISVLDDPEGNPWVMKSFSLITFPDQKFAEIATLGSRLKLPAGWKFRSVVLEQDLILTPDKTGTAHITQDNFGNTYDRAGGEYSNFKP